MRILLIVYDNASYVPYFPQGLGYIASALLDVGVEVEIYNQDMHHYPDQHLTDYLNKNKFDAVGVSVIGGYYQYRKLLRISKAINQSNNRPFYILGGHGPSPEPEYFIKKTGADAIVIGEGEETIVDLMDAIASHRDLCSVKGIAYRDGNSIEITQRRDLIKNIDKISMPAYDLFPMEFYRLVRETNCSSGDFLMPVLSGRGCTFKCNFCYRMDKGFRPRSNESIIEEILFLKEKYLINYIIFSDELLMSSVERTESLCKAILKARLNIKWWCNGRLNYAKGSLLRLMKKAGCVFINYGIESFDDIALKNMNKILNSKQIVSGVEATLEVGISPGLNIIWGNIGENAETLKKGVRFLKKYGDGSQLRTIRPVTPYPGSPLYYYAIENNLLKDIEEFYEKKHVNSDLLTVNFTNLTDEQFYQNLHKANGELIDDYYTKKKRMIYNDIDKLYIDRNVNFRGFRQL